MLLIPYDTGKCLSFNSKTDYHQCKYKHKQTSDLCGIHMRKKRKYTVIDNNKKVLNKIIPLFPYFKHLKIIIRYIRKYMGKRQTKSVNDTDFYTLEPIENIPKKYYFTYLEKNKLRYSFDIRSLTELIKSSIKKPRNPYTQQPIPQSIQRLCIDRIKLIDDGFVTAQIQEAKQVQRDLFIKRVAKVSKIIRDDGYDGFDDHYLVNLKLYEIKQYYNILYRLWAKYGRNNENKRIKHFMFKPGVLIDYELYEIRTVLIVVLEKMLCSNENATRAFNIILIITGLTKIFKSLNEKYGYLAAY
jgi:hypothetical protein